jgi:glyoxylase-like metal-dependent hydrolase (beta-lactamase superfamily II)
MIELLAAGWCRHPECSLMRGGSWRSLSLPAGVALIRHPRLGIGLFDTGYSQRFIEATKPFPERIYRWITPPQIPVGCTAVEQIRCRGIAAVDVRWIVLSHLHADHIAGVIDFPRAQIYLHGDALRAMRHRGRWANLLHGTLPSLLPADLDARTTVLEASDFSFASGAHSGWPSYDLAGDGSLLVIPLPGHAAGQVGLQVRPPQAPPMFLVADASWTSASIAQGLGPPKIATLIFESAVTAQVTLGRLHDLAVTEPDLRLVPSHCPTWWPAFEGSSVRDRM